MIINVPLPRKAAPLPEIATIFRPRAVFLCAHLTVATLLSATSAYAQETQAPPASTDTTYIREIRVKGATKLPGAEVEEAVYPYMGPGRTAGDIEEARAALE
ncbi:MAG: hypothetical protein ACREKL_12155, partial [Chthoniobacterales bacterium]